MTPEQKGDGLEFNHLTLITVLVQEALQQYLLFGCILLPDALSETCFCDGEMVVKDRIFRPDKYDLNKHFKISCCTRTYVRTSTYITHEVHYHNH